MFLSKNQYHYFSHCIKGEELEVYWNTILWNFAANLAYLFEPIFLFKLGYSPVEILKFYLLVYIGYAVLVLPISKITSRIGYKHAIFISTLAYVAYWLFFYQIQFQNTLFYLVPALFAVQKSFFWPAYNAEVAINNTKDQRGREVGVLYSLVEVSAIIAPILGGFVSYLFGFKILFAAAAVLMIFSALPFFRTKDVYTRHKFGFKNFLVVLKKYPQNFFAYWGYAEDLMLMTLWPLYIFLVVPSVRVVGIVVTVASLIAVVLMLYLGQLFDRQKSRRLLEISSFFYGLSWTVRFLANSVGWVLGFDVLTRLGKAGVTIPLETITFDITGQSGPDFAIAYAVFNEFSLSIGKICMALVGIWILAATGSIPLVFVAAGFLTIFYGILRK